MTEIFRSLEEGGGAFGVDELTPSRLLQYLLHRFSNFSEKSLLLGRALDSFIEVQIHGDIQLKTDVAQLVVDPAFRNHYPGETLKQISALYEIPLGWHPGFRISVEQVPEFFRGYPIAPLARRAAGAGLLDAANLGVLANSVELEPDAWKDWASYEDTLTQFRRLWHFLVLEGMPATSFSHEQST